MSISTKLLSIHIDPDSHDAFKSLAKSVDKSMSLILQNYIDALLDGSEDIPDNLLDQMVQVRSLDGSRTPYTRRKKSPNGKRRIRRGRENYRSDLNCKHCGVSFDQPSAASSHERHCKGDEITTRRYRMWWAKTRYHRNNHRTDKLGNRIEMRLSFEEYCLLLDEAGIDYASRENVLGRYRDIGHYEMGNCRYITARQNAIESHYSQLLITLGKSPDLIPLNEYKRGLKSFENDVNSNMSSL